MPTNDRERREESIAVKKGTTGPARRRRTNAAEDVAPPTPEELDARQEAIDRTRRRGPDLPAGQSNVMADALRPEVPPTEADGPEDIEYRTSPRSTP